MDILTRLRVLLWVLVLSLWGTMVYQFLGEDSEPEAKMQWFANPFRNSLPLPTATPQPVSAPAAAGAEAPPLAAASPAVSAPPTAASPSASPSSPASEIAAETPVVPMPAPWAHDKSHLAAAPPPGTHFIKPLPTKFPRTANFERPRLPQ